MNILILDDQEIIFRAPADYFVDPHDFRNDNVIQVAHPDQFWEMYYGRHWDIIWLDHDLGNPEYNGRDITKRFAEMGHDGMDLSHLQIWITSMNPVAADAMYTDISHYTNIQVFLRNMSTLHELGISRGGVFTNTHNVLRRPSGFLV